MNFAKGGGFLSCKDVKLYPFYVTKMTSSFAFYMVDHLYLKIRVNYTTLLFPSKMLVMLKYTLPFPLIQNISENISLPFSKRSLNYILLPSYVKTYNLIPQCFFYF